MTTGPITLKVDDRGTAVIDIWPDLPAVVREPWPGLSARRLHAHSLSFLPWAFPVARFPNC